MRVEFDRVTRRFGRTIALDACTLQIPSGAQVALVGPNGSGKSTLTRIVMGMLAYEGTVRIDDLDPSRERETIARRLAYVPQSPPQLQAATGEIVAAIVAVRRLDPDRLVDGLAVLGLDFAEIAQRPVRALSGGMKQKLMLALAFASDAGLLLLDEPTASLDAASRLAFYRLVRERAGDSTLLLCSHRLDEVRHLVQQVIVLEEGRVAWRGSIVEYLHGSAHSMIEVQTSVPAAASWLRARGFVPGGAGDWTCIFTRAAGLAVMGQLFAAHGGDLESVRVRDLETIDETILQKAEA
ncbi:MAG TPA: ABC transporter ATP-binding protein [Candidatus Krumholzibacteria bacterium]|nr:ABC transporter ATP-binding protein [Candidatus Krumholzibacteria bacterium]HPD70233.1 ABC transporter ATP-binding protein [Candidatus Krumholzibacteria bacterium]HRY40067.1 ABC transporter ATP-binding protein [Candidatus Krumholzibacteria bacterium]